jgi:hypothetical protein
MLGKGEGDMPCRNGDRSERAQQLDRGNLAVRCLRDCAVDRPAPLRCLRCLRCLRRECE